MNARRARPNRFPWPPIILAGSILLSIGLQYLYPLEASFTFSRLLGAALIFAALATDIWAMKTLHDSSTTVLPHRASSHLVTKGPFQYSRNPIYVANMLLLTGIGLVTANGWFLIAAPLDGVLTHFLAVRREENHLHALFGFKYEDYCRRVRRWI